MNCCRRKGSPKDLDIETMLVRDSRLPIVWIFGGPCAGKTALCNRITERFNFMHIDCDTVLRFEALTQSSRGLQISAKLNRREQIPDEILVQILREILPRNVKITNGYLLDNFPNTIEQGRLFEKKVCHVTALLYMKVSAETMTKRFNQRREKDSRPESAKQSSYRMPTVHDVALRSDRIEVQIRNFITKKVDILREYEGVLYVLNAEKSRNYLHNTVELIIRNICSQNFVELPRESLAGRVKSHHLEVNLSARRNEEESGNVAEPSTSAAAESKPLPHETSQDSENQNEQMKDIKELGEKNTPIQKSNSNSTSTGKQGGAKNRFTTKKAHSNDEIILTTEDKKSEQGIDKVSKIKLQSNSYETPENTRSNSEKANLELMIYSHNSSDTITNAKNAKQKLREMKS